jgi:hypothetical protein
MVWDAKLMKLALLLLASIPLLAQGPPFVPSQSSGGTSGGGSGTATREFTASFCSAGTCANDPTTNVKPIAALTGTIAIQGCYVVFYGVIPSSTITIDVRKNSTTSSNGTDLLSTSWTFSTATLGTPLAFGGTLAAVTLAQGDQVGIYMTGTTGQGMTVSCAAQ